MSKEKSEVRAAGGIIIRNPKPINSEIEVAVVHRPRYNDWSFPKGKRDRTDANDEATALREIEEETGLVCRLGDELKPTCYRDGRGQDKIVRYWLVEIVGPEEFIVNEEVDELRWCTLSEAHALLTYEHDRKLLSSVGSMPRELTNPKKSP